MAMFLHGETVVLINKKQHGFDPFGSPVYETEEIEVENVLINQGDTDAVLDTTNFTGQRVAYTLAIPKTDTNVWENGLVRFWGKEWRVIGTPVQGQSDLTPLDWNKKVKVEAYEN